MQQIEQADKLTRVFGRWPSFHDAEVLRLVLDRAGGAPTLELHLHVFETTSEVDRAGQYITRNHTLVIIRFVDIVVHELAGFNEQNVLFDLSIVQQAAETGSSRLRVEMSSSYGVSGSFECGRAVVVQASPYEAAA